MLSIVLNTSDSNVNNTVCLQVAHNLMLVNAVYYGLNPPKLIY